MNNINKLVGVRFDRAVLEQLTEEELSLLYLMYHKLFNREIDLRSVFVQPVINKIKKIDTLTEEGCKVRDNIIKKIEQYYQY